MSQMKLYVWNDPYPVKYGQSMVIAVAENLRDAKKQAAKGPLWHFGDLGGEPRDWSHIKLGKPSRVVKLPCAEWHEWSE